MPSALPKLRGFYQPLPLAGAGIDVVNAEARVDKLGLGRMRHGGIEKFGIEIEGNFAGIRPKGTDAAIFGDDQTPV